MKTRTQITTEQITAEFFQTSRSWCQTVLANRPDIQRTLNPRRVNAIVRDLLNDTWKPTFDPIRLSDEGWMIDGQHRVSAFLKADVYPTILLLKGFDIGIYPDIDVSGQPKSPGESFRQLGINNYTTASSISKYVAVYLEGKSMQNLATLSQSLEVYYDHEDIIQNAIKEFRALELILSKTRKGILIVLGTKFLGERFTHQFFSDVESGIGSPGATLFRKTLVANANKARGKLSSLEVLALGIKAMLSDYNGTDIKLLKWIKGEEFPRLEGATGK